jgi:hypothetical protein
MLTPLNSISQFIIIFFLIFSAINALPEMPSVSAGCIIVIDKAQKDLNVFRGGKQTAEFPASFGIDPDSDKYKAHDCATPEGLYFITYKKDETRFHRLLGISYPNLVNAEKGLAGGVISLNEYHKIYEAAHKSRRTTSETRLGSGIAIHGGGVFKSFGKTRERDWTEGCIALNDKDMENLFGGCSPGDPVIIFNSRRNLYGLIRPFTHSKDRDEKGVPVCPDGVCMYQVEIPTSLGWMKFMMKEGKDYGRSLQVMVYHIDDLEKPILTLVDQNADGLMSSMDSVTGMGVDETKPQEVYQQVRASVITTLSKGELSDISIRR